MELVQRVLQQAEDLRRQSIEAHADLSEMKADALEKLIGKPWMDPKLARHLSKAWKVFEKKAK